MAHVTMATGWELKLQPHIGDFLDKIADDIADDARRYAPVDTGRLASKIKTSKVGVRRRRITAHTEYAVYVEMGTRPHKIYPKSITGVLVFWHSGKLQFRSEVNHPGTRAQPYLRPALFTKRSA